LTYVLLPLTGRTLATGTCSGRPDRGPVTATRKLSNAQQADAVKLLSGTGLAYAVVRVPPPVGPGGTDWTTVRRWVTYADSVYSVP
jgi:hypothetical protein